MKYIRKITLALYSVILCALCTVGCKAPYSPSDKELFEAREDICISVGYKQMIDFTPESLQYSYNPDKLLFRAGVSTTQIDGSTGYEVEIVQHFFVLKLNESLGVLDGDVTGTLYLTSDKLASGSRSYDIKNGKIIKISGNKAWIWDDVLRLGVVVAVTDPGSSPAGQPAR